jgi:hypothetical protein
MRAANSRRAPAESWDLVALEDWLARLPPAQPCFGCPSHDAEGKLRFIQPVLGVAVHGGHEVNAAIFDCPLCGTERAEPLK